MLNLIKNLKVGTKLALILAPPVVVLIVLAVIGVQQRTTEADEARQAERLATFAAATSDLTHELELESLASADYLGFAGGEDGEAAAGRDAALATLEERRTATDGARDAYLAALEELDPASAEGGDGGQIAQKIDSADDRLRNLDTIRTSITELQSPGPQAVKDLTAIATALVNVNVPLAAVTNEPELAAGLRSFANLGRMKDSLAAQASYMVLPARQGQFRAWSSPTVTEPCGSADESPLAASTTGACPLVQELVTARDSFTSNSLVFDADATPEHLQILRDSEVNQTFGSVESRVFAAAEDTANDLTEGSNAVTAEEVVESATSRLEALRSAETSIITDTLADAAEVAEDASRQATAYAVGSLGAVAIALIFAFFVFRATTIPLRKLTSAAYTLSTDRLPALVDRLRNPEADTGESLAATLTPIDIESKDEIGQLADAFNSIQQVTVEVAEEQAALLRKGIGDIFINLARRNQTLLDRQIEFIDQLESNEEDPDQLDNLFKLDHLATRMRRNAESLLVLAGAEPPRRRGRPVSLADVVRVAIGEVEDFARIQLLSLDEATVGGNVAVDLAHLLSELMENATHFSPPDTMVEIVGHRGETGYVLSVSDQGIGMSADQLAEANDQLAKPPLVGLALSRSLGFIVIGRLASRFDVHVKLTSSPSGGVTAMVTLPREIVTFAGDDAPEVTEPATTTAPDEDEGEATLVLDDAGEDLIDELLDGAPTASADTGVDGGLDGPALDQDEDWERSLESLRQDELPEAPVEPEVRVPPAPEPPAAEEPVPAPVAPEPAVVEPPAPAADEAPTVAPITAAGLVKRTPKKRSENATGGGMPGGGGANVAPSRQSSRSPEEIRKMLSRYRSGLNKGRAGADADGGGE